MHALVIDDEERFARLVQTRLELEGHRVEIALDAATGLALARAIPFDLALVDLVLPDADGADVASALRELAPTLFVVLMSGMATSPDDETLLLAAVDAVLPKPWRPPELAAVLARAASSGG